MLCFNVSMFIMGFILYFSKPHVLFSNNALYFTCKCRFFCTYDRSPRSIFDDFAGESSRLRTGTLLSTRTSGTTESTTPTLLIFRNSFPRRVELRPWSVTETHVTIRVDAQVPTRINSAEEFGSAVSGCIFFYLRKRKRKEERTNTKTRFVNNGPWMVMGFPRPKEGHIIRGIFFFSFFLVNIRYVWCWLSFLEKKQYRKEWAQ
jgi:hypothetical protein